MNTNPFVLPGFGQSGQLGQNPILASMEMMRQAWEGLASSGGMDAAAMGRMMSIEEMDKRISDLRAVENWLRMNLSMLSSTIQGLEVQRATVATLKSFVDTGMASMAQPAAGSPASAAQRPASPLEEVLGLKPGGAQAGGQPASGRAGRDAPSASAGGQHSGEAEPPSGTQGRSGGAEGAGQPAAGASGAQAGQTEQADIVGAAASAAQGWWNLLQQQFQTLAAATAASAEGAFSELAEAGKAVAAAGQPPAGNEAGARPAAKKTAARSAAAKTASGPAARSSGRKTAAPASAARPAKSAKSAKSASPRAAARKMPR